MAKSEVSTYRVAVVWRGDLAGRAEATADNNRLKAIFAALARAGISAEPAVFCEDVADEVRTQLLTMDGVLVWVDPIATATGQRRSALDDILREVAQAGVLIGAHPDVIAKMGVKSVLHRTRSLGWGTDTRLYETPAAFQAEFPRLLASGARVLKQNRGNGGIGVWKVDAVDTETVRVLEARGGAVERTMALGDFVAERLAEFDAGGGLVDQPFQARLLDGMVRCYLSGGRVAGFGHQMVRALAPAEAGPAGPRLYSGPDDPRFQRLRALMEEDWTPGLVQRLGMSSEDLPVIWDADFLLGPKTAEGEDSYVLCEINVSSVFPIPDEAPATLAATTLQRLTARPPKLSLPT
ncbi:Cj0069 family protein [Phenylobacterium aquaticum]|uniref:Cj0069 family protein n=1 Tax=Phenylobacterium aquaticum TaxID=1763816 RepID=UPI001F5C4FAF|nr:Cj0069 family protein [Phenylobacterium aquaticum]MCI3132841.1 Cj0069 family protein [Phenylobacterium aquaticum]